MRYIRFNMSKGNPITVPEEKALLLLKSERKIDLISDEEGNWTGESINKSHIVSTQRDFEKERDVAEKKRIEGKKDKNLSERIKLTQQKYGKTPMLQ